jgi:hypothetical protein
MPNYNYRSKDFQSLLYNIRQYSFLNCFLDFNYYSMPILRTSNFVNFLHASKHVFPQQWAFLSSHWNINQEQDGTDVLDKVMDYKSSDALPNMDDYVFEDESEDNEADDDECDMQNNRNDVSTRPCLLDLTGTG